MVADKLVNVSYAFFLNDKKICLCKVYKKHVAAPKQNNRPK